MRAVCALQHSRASKEEVERACLNLKESTLENFEILRLKCEANSLKIFENEKIRQKDALLDYENEKLWAVINDSKNSVLVQIQMSSSFIRIKGEIREALHEKQRIFELDLETQNLSEIVKSLAVEQIEAETMREEYELKGAYFSLIFGITVSEKLMSEMVEGFCPSFLYITELFLFGFLSEFEVLSYALEKDFMQRKFNKKVMAATIHREFEENRLFELERSPTDLEKIYTEIDKRLKTDLEELENDFEREKTELKKLLLSQLEDKNKSLVCYQNNVQIIIDKNKLNVSEMETSYNAEREVLEEKKNTMTSLAYNEEVNQEQSILQYFFVSFYFLFYS